jgi:hypothetical protein
MSMRNDVTAQPHPDANTPAGSGRRRPDRLPHAFAPVHKRALGVAVGFMAGLAFFFVTAFHLLIQPSGAPPIALLSQYFYGYEVSWWGALVGLFWGGVTGFVAGWFVAFVRNLVTAIRIFIFRTKGELAQTKDFLDHI